MPRTIAPARAPFRSKARNMSARGHSAERELKKKLEAKGCFVFRSAASLGELGDLLALVPIQSDGGPLWIVGCEVPIRARVLAIEVKCGQQRVWGPERKRKRELAEKFGALALVALRADKMSAAERWKIEVA